MPATAPGVIPLMWLIGLGTLGSEDLASLSAGVLAARGDLPFAAATIAAFVGIVLGDAVFFVVGRLVGRPALERAPLNRLVTFDALERSAAWLNARGARVLLASRFVPGTRVATHLAAGFLGMRPAHYLGASAAAAALWTPILVGAGAAGGAWTLPGGLPPFGVLAAAAVVLLAGRALLTCRTYAGRRAFVGAWRRLTQWEFWPPWLAYLPMLPWGLWLAARCRGLTVFTAANPGIPSGGFIGESKIAILGTLSDGGAPVARFTALPGGASADARSALAAMAASQLGLPLVFKPDVGQRGSGVRIARTPAEVDEEARRDSRATVIQAYVPGVEFGLFYVRRPGEPAGRVISITEKRMPFVVGDGTRSIRTLIADDPRAVALARVYERHLGNRVDLVPPPGRRVRLCELGSHCRGAVFLDGSRVRTPALERAVDRAARAHPGFAFGRFDVRAPSVGALAEGRFTILELNGVTAEPAHIYDPAVSIWSAYRALASAWQQASEIGRYNADRGARVRSVRELAGLLLACHRQGAQNSGRERAGEGRGRGGGGESNPGQTGVRLGERPGSQTRVRPGSDSGQTGVRLESESSLSRV